MNLDLLSSDTTLAKALEESEAFETVSRVASTEDALNEVLLISDTILNFDELSVTSFKDEQIVFYMLTNNPTPGMEKNIKAICESKGVILVPSRLVVSQIVEFIEEKVRPETERKTNVVTFFSSISNVGTTSTVLSVAESLIDSSKSKVGVLLLNAWDDGTDQILDYKGSYLGSIRSRLTNELISTGDESREEFLSMFHMKRKDRLYVLAGNNNVKTERLFTPNEINILISKARDIFDIVLIDAGCHFDNAIIYQALRESDLKYLIVNQQPKAVKRLNQVYREMLYPLGYEKTDFLLVINQFKDKSHYPTTKDIQSQLKVPLVSTIEFTENSLTSELDQKTLYHYDSENIYGEAIKIIGKSMATVVDIDFIVTEEDSKAKKKRFKFL